MSRTPQSLLRLPVQITIWTLLLIALLGPHTHWSVCLTGRCNQPAVATFAATLAADIDGDAAACSCCHHHKVGDAGKGGDGENGAPACLGCCIDLAMAIDEAPLPTPVTVPHFEQGVIALLPDSVPAPGHAQKARFAGLDTGPPRTDRRTDLIAITILRE